MNIFTPLNHLIQYVFDAGLTNTLYWLWPILNYTVLMLFCLRYRRHYGLSKLQAIGSLAIVFVTGFLWMLLMGWAASGFTRFGDNNIVKGYCFFALFSLIPAKLFKLDKKVIWDFIAPACALTQVTGHLSCNFAGCCHGYPWKYGVWNIAVQDYLFPTQLLESLVALLVCLACIRYAKSSKYSADGKVYPFFLVSFGATRFFLEFLRDNEKLFWGISELALWAVLMVVVGIVWFWIVSFRTRRDHA